MCVWFYFQRILLVDFLKAALEVQLVYFPLMIYSFYTAYISNRQTSEKEPSPSKGLYCGVLSKLLAALQWESVLNSSQL